MYSDLLDVLGNQSSSSTGRDSDKQVAVSFKAGKCDLAMQDSGKYKVTADTRRGQVQLVWKEGNLNWEFLDRRDQSIISSVKVEANTRFERVLEGPKAETDRIYVWTKNKASKQYEMYWMQDQATEGEDDIIAQVNQLLANPTKTVDALSNILENLGMPESTNATTGGGTTTSGGNATSNNNSNNNSSSGAAPSSSNAPRGTLTLADLQGAMAGVQTSVPLAPVAPPVPLNEVVTPEAISSLLQDEGAKNRLLEFLPEEQRTMERLEENLRSPQIQATLRSLTQALAPDETGSLEGYHSVIANFALNPQDGERALTSGNPIQAFLDCVLASVKKEEEGKTAEESKEKEEEKASEVEDTAMEETKEEESKDDAMEE